MDKIWEKFVRIAEDNDGVIRTSQVEAAGISRPMLKKYMDLGKLERIRKGLYILSGEVADEYVLLQAQKLSFHMERHFFSGGCQTERRIF